MVTSGDCECTIVSATQNVLINFIYVILAFFLVFVTSGLEMYSEFIYSLF